MYCTYCKMARIENEAPCPNCGAPSPLLSQSYHVNGGAGSSREAAFGAQWEQSVPQLAFDDPVPPATNTALPSWQEQQGYRSAAPAWQQPAEAYNPLPSWQQPAETYNPVPPRQQPIEPYNPMPSWQRPATGHTPPWQGGWQQGSDKHTAQGSQVQGGQEQQSLLPVPYEAGMALQPAERQSTISLQLVPDHAIQHLLIPQQEAAATVYVAPMYTKPRPIVPKYRVISGLLSIIIMALVVCAGVGYYAQTEGVLAKATQFVTGTPPKNLPLVSSSNIQDPPEQTGKDLGPAYNAIPSAVTTLNIDKNNLARQPAKIFKPGQVFYLVFSVQAPADGKGGKVRTRWYTNDKFFTEISSQGLIKPGEIKSGNIQMRFTMPLSGRVEIFWNDQFAQKLYFAVK